MTDSHASAAVAKAGTGDGRYLYGVVRAGALPTLRRARLGVGRSLQPVRHDEVCALTAAAPPRMGRDALSRHADVVQRVFERTTILPARFGVVLPDPEQVVAGFLGPYHDQLVAQLDRLDGMAQVDVTGVHREEQALARLLKASPTLAARRREGTRSQLAAIRLGQRVAAGLERMRAQDAAVALDALRRHAVGERPSTIAHQHMFLHAAFLVRAADVQAFDDAVGELQRRLPHAATRAVGPQAPYAFVELHPVEEAAWA